MKILLIADPMLPVPPIGYGGVERLLDMLINEYLRRGLDVKIIAHPASQPQCEVVPLTGLNVRGVRDTLRNVLVVRRTVRSWRPDVVHSFGRLAYMSAILRRRLPKVMSYGREPTLSQIRKASMLARRDSLVIAACAQHIARKVRGSAHVEVVFNGVPAHIYTPSYEVPPDAPLVFLGRIEPIKGTDTAIRVAQRSGRRLVIAGNISSEGGGEEFFREQVKPHIDGDRVTYVGPVNDDQKNELLRSAAGFLMPIRWEEPFGMVMAEALACGTPVIGLRRGAVQEVVIHGKTGFVCDTEDEMVAAIGSIATLDRQACRADFDRRFSDHAVADAYLDLYKRMTHVTSGTS